MDTQDLRTLRLLEEIEDNQLPSQRYLASQLNVSLGLTNAFIKRLTKKGYFKIKAIPKNRIKYIITPKGVAEKTRLTFEYVHYSFKFYRRVRISLHELFLKLIEQNVLRIVFFGANEIAEIAYVSLQETPIELIAVVDENKVGERFLKFTILEKAKLESLSFDSIIITEVGDKAKEIEDLLKLGIPNKKIALFEPQ